MIRCNTGEHCQCTWETMRETRNNDTRFCTQCQQVVYWIEDYEGFKRAARQNQCIAFSASLLDEVKKQQSEAETLKQFLLMPQQKLSLKQLTHIKKYLHPELSLRELRDAYHQRSAIIKFVSCGTEVGDVLAILRRVGIQIELKQESVGSVAPA